MKPGDFVVAQNTKTFLQADLGLLLHYTPLNIKTALSEIDTAFGSKFIQTKDAHYRLNAVLLDEMEYFSTYNHRLLFEEDREYSLYDHAHRFIEKIPYNQDTKHRFINRIVRVNDNPKYPELYNPFIATMVTPGTTNIPPCCPIGLEFAVDLIHDILRHRLPRRYRTRIDNTVKFDSYTGYFDPEVLMDTPTVKRMKESFDYIVEMLEKMLSLTTDCSENNLIDFFYVNGYLHLINYGDHRLVDLALVKYINKADEVDIFKSTIPDQETAVDVFYTIKEKVQDTIRLQLLNPKLKVLTATCG